VSLLKQKPPPAIHLGAQVAQVFFFVGAMDAMRQYSIPPEKKA